MNSVFKISSGFLLGIYSTHYYKNQQIRQESTQITTYNGTLEKLIVDRKLVQSEQMKNILNSKFKRFFVHDTLKTDLKGFNLFDIYFEQDFKDKIDKKEILTAEEKQQLGKIYLFFSANSSVQGHDNVLHGGVSATILDDLMGKLSYILSDYNPVATANLNINYKKPCFIGKQHYVVANLEKQEGERKVFLKFQVFDQDNKLIQDGSSLFLKVNWNQEMFKKLAKFNNN